MQYRRLGSSGLQLVGAVLRRLAHLRRPNRPLPRARPDRRGLGPRHQLLRQRRGLCQRRGREGHGRRDRRPAPAARWLLRVEQGVLRRGRPIRCRRRRACRASMCTDACHAALKRLRVDYLDLYYCHRPDPDTPIEETVWAMDALIRQGKVLYWGTSEWPAAQIREAHKVARAHHLHAPTMEQPQYNLLHRERVELEYAPLYAESAWAPPSGRRWHRACSPASTTTGCRAKRGSAGKGYGWLQRIGARRRANRAGSSARASSPITARRTGHRAGAAGDRLVPAQPACVQRDPGREPHRAAAAEPGGAGPGRTPGGGGLGAHRSGRCGHSESVC